MTRKKLPASPERGAYRVLEELCTDDACDRDGTHWHPFDFDSFLAEDEGEYTVTLRVRIEPKETR
jgi:hypothetical protein